MRQAQPEAHQGRAQRGCPVKRGEAEKQHPTNGAAAALSMALAELLVMSSSPTKKAEEAGLLVEVPRERDLLPIEMANRMMNASTPAAEVAVRAHVSQQKAMRRPLASTILSS